MKHYFFLILPLFFYVQMYSQNDFSVSKSYLAWENQRLEKKRGVDEYPYQQINRTLEIKVWIVRNEMGTLAADISDINDWIAGTNQYFKQIGLNFKVCSQEIIEDYHYSLLTDSINMEMNAKSGDSYYNAKPSIDDSNINLMVNSYYEPHVINVYYVDYIILTEHDTVAGFASMPHSDGINQKYDRVFIAKNGHSTLVHVHEFGHFFGLHHTHEFELFGRELVDGTNCATAGDLICDTPAEFNLKDAIFLSQNSCNLDPFAVPSDPKGQRYIPNVGNIMSYAKSLCIKGFSEEQYKKMVEVYFSFKTYLR